jgi:hypothetical protein
MTPEIYLYLYPHFKLFPVQQVRIIISLKSSLYLQQQASSSMGVLPEILCAQAVLVSPPTPDLITIFDQKPNSRWSENTERTWLKF